MTECLIVWLAMAYMAYSLITKAWVEYFEVLTVKNAVLWGACCILIAPFMLLYGIIIFILVMTPVIYKADWVWNKPIRRKHTQIHVYRPEIKKRKK